MGKVVSVNVSKKKGTIKRPVSEIEVLKDIGVKDDAHAGPGDRQVSLLMQENIDEMRSSLASGADCEVIHDGIELGPGTFAENVTTEGIDLISLVPGSELVIGEKIRLRVTRIGKDCHKRCAIFYKVGDCIMPGKGVFAQVIKGGIVRAGDTIDKG